MDGDPGGLRALQKSVMQAESMTFTTKTAASSSIQRPGLQARVAYGFLILALCLMIADFCRLVRAPHTMPLASSTTYHSTRI